MDFEQLAKIENESERVNRTYDIFHEDSRLNHSKAARVEFLTTVRYIERYLKEGDRILDIGAGAGEYSFYFARKGYDVSALELADANIAAFRKKLTLEDRIDLVQGNALDLSRYADKSFDIVLLFGPLYHLKQNSDKQRCIREAKRVCKDGGKIFFAFIANDFVFSHRAAIQCPLLFKRRLRQGNVQAQRFSVCIPHGGGCKETVGRRWGDRTSRGRVRRGERAYGGQNQRNER